MRAGLGGAGAGVCVHSEANRSLPLPLPPLMAPDISPAQPAAAPLHPPPPLPHGGAHLQRAPCGGVHERGAAQGVGAGGVEALLPTAPQQVLHHRWAVLRVRAGGVVG